MQPKSALPLPGFKKPKQGPIVNTQGGKNAKWEEPSGVKSQHPDQLKAGTTPGQ